MKILVIGATGYVGSAVARAFAARGNEVHGLARNAENRADLAAAGLSPIDGSLDDLPSLALIVQPFDVVVMAAMVPFEAEAAIMEALIAGCRQRNTPTDLFFTSGT